MILETESINFSYNSTPVLHDVSIVLKPGITAIIGPNAAGKSTLFRCLNRTLKPEGQVLLNGKSIKDYKPVELAGYISYLPQNLSTRAVLTVFEMVLMGRLNQLGWFINREDTRYTEQLLDEFGLSNLSSRYVSELSGGQFQLVAIAQALAREPSVLLLDEPSTSLDLNHQFEIFSLIKKLTVARGICTAMSIHDINMAARIADVIYVLESGRIINSGPPESVLTEELIASVYNVRACVGLDDDGRLLITPMGIK